MRRQHVSSELNILTSRFLHDREKDCEPPQSERTVSNILELSHPFLPASSKAKNLSEMRSYLRRNLCDHLSFDASLNSHQARHLLKKVYEPNVAPLTQSLDESYLHFLSRSKPRPKKFIFNQPSPPQLSTTPRTQ